MNVPISTTNNPISQANPSTEPQSPPKLQRTLSFKNFAAKLIPRSSPHQVSAAPNSKLMEPMKKAESAYSYFKSADKSVVYIKHTTKPLDSSEKKEETKIFQATHGVHFKEVKNKSKIDKNAEVLFEEVKKTGIEEDGQIKFSDGKGSEYSIQAEALKELIRASLLVDKTASQIFKLVDEKGQTQDFIKTQTGEKKYLLSMKNITSGGTSTIYQSVNLLNPNSDSFFVTKMYTDKGNMLDKALHEYKMGYLINPDENTCLVAPPHHLINITGSITNTKGSLVGLLMKEYKGSLDKFINNTTTWPPEQIIGQILRLFNGAKELNNKNIAHFDIKLANIFVDKDDKFSIGDFDGALEINNDIAKDPRFNGTDELSVPFMGACSRDSILKTDKEWIDKIGEAILKKNEELSKLKEKLATTKKNDSKAALKAEIHRLEEDVSALTEKYKQMSINMHTFAVAHAAYQILRGEQNDFCLDGVEFKRKLEANFSQKEDIAMIEKEILSNIWDLIEMGVASLSNSPPDIITTDTQIPQRADINELIKKTEINLMELIKAKHTK